MKLELTLKRVVELEPESDYCLIRDAIAGDGAAVMEAMFDNVPLGAQMSSASVEDYGFTAKARRADDNPVAVMGRLLEAISECSINTQEELEQYPAWREAVEVGPRP